MQPKPKFGKINFRHHENKRKSRGEIDANQELIKRNGHDEHLEQVKNREIGDEGFGFGGEFGPEKELVF